MHPITVAEFASTFVRFVPAWLSHRVKPDHGSVQRYWLYTRYRHDDWSGRLAEHSQAIERQGICAREHRWTEITPVIQEVLMTEPLARVLMIVGNLFERLRITDELAALANSALQSHTEARNRCLHLMVFGQGLSVQRAVRFNRLRRKLERYSDQLLASLPEHPSKYDQYFEPECVDEPPKDIAANSHCWLTLHTQLISSLLWKNVQNDIEWRSVNGRLNSQIVQSVLGMLPQQLFDDVGAPRSSQLSQRLAFESPEADEKSPNHPSYFFQKHAANRKIRSPHHRRW